jgi:hypothetical protein
MVAEGVDGRMKRWYFIVVAAMVVLLSYPSTHALAGSSKDISKIRILTPLDGGEPIALSGDDDGDDGDADGLAGNAKPNRHSGPDSSADVRVMIQVWWKFLVWLR